MTSTTPPANASRPARAEPSAAPAAADGPEGGSCLSCGSPGAPLVRRTSPRVRRCAACGARFLAELPDPIRQAELYGAAYYSADDGARFLAPLEWLVTGFRELRARAILRRLRPPSTGRDDLLVDVGCGRGRLLERFRRRGWRAIGTQLSATATATARRRGLEVHLGDLAELGLPAACARAVTLYHVLEHLDRPREMLAEVRRVLREDGLLVVEVPDGGSPAARLLGPRDFCFDHPHHLIFLDRCALLELLRRSGFEVISLSRFSLEYSPFSTLQNLLNLLPGRPQRLYRALARSAEGARLRRSPWTWLHALIAVPLAPVALLLSCASLVLPVGNTLRAICRVASADPASAAGSGAFPHGPADETPSARRDGAQP